MNKRVRNMLLGLFIILLISVVIAWWHHRQDQPDKLVRAELGFARTDWLAEEAISLEPDLRNLASSFQQAPQMPSTPPNHEAPLYSLSLHFLGQQLDFWLTHDLRVFNQSLDQEVLLDSVGQQTLRDKAENLRSKQFGELLPWSEAKQLIPLYSIFTVVDVETGLCFKTQRRAGSQHADIQPLTKQDTEILKTIYGGEWSWDRRAVVVEIGGKRIAASMHGMPHGAGALVNGFPGHHCLHFLGSTTHGGGRSDPMHQLMVQKAAGQLHEYLDQLPPDALQNLALEVAGQGDATTIGLLIVNSGSGLESLTAEIRDIRIWSTQVGAANDGKLIGKYSVGVFFRNDPREYRTSLTITCRYIGTLGKWLVEPDYLQQLTNARK